MHIDHRRLYEPITKWYAALETGNVYPVLKKALEIAGAEQPGPVHIDLPEDFAEELSSETIEQFAPSAPPQPAAREDALRRAEELIKRARYPLVALGLGMNRAGATEDLRKFITKHRLPVVTTLMAKGHIPETGGHLVGVLGRARRDLVAEFCRPADLIIAIGYDPVEFNFEEWMTPELPLIHIDTVPADIDRGYSLAGEVIGPIRETLRRLLKIPPLQNDWNFDALAGHRGKLLEALSPARATFSPHHALHAMREILPPGGILAADVGAHTHLIGQLWDPIEPGNLLVSNGWSSMGFAIPAAVAAKLIRPERPVMACAGDGGFLMTLGEINTAVRLKLPVVFVVFRDRYLSLIRVKQQRKEYHGQGVELLGPDYSPSDNLFGAKVIVAAEEESFRQALRAGLEGGKPIVIEAVVDPAEYNAIL
jgi:acetolactate synthase I/II/III large subunit